MDRSAGGKRQRDEEGTDGNQANKHNDRVDIYANGHTHTHKHTQNI